MRKILLISLICCSSSYCLSQNPISFTYYHNDDSPRTVVYLSNSIFLSWLQNGSSEQINECSLENRLSLVKKDIVEVLKRHKSILPSKITSKDSKFVISLLPYYNGRVADVWLSWKGSSRPFTEETLSAITGELLKIQIQFDKESNLNDTSFCQYLTFGILEKDWDYILGKDK